MSDRGTQSPPSLVELRRGTPAFTGMFRRGKRVDAGWD